MLKNRIIIFKIILQYIFVFACCFTLHAATPVIQTNQLGGKAVNGVTSLWPSTNGGVLFTVPSASGDAHFLNKTNASGLIEKSALISLSLLDTTRLFRESLEAIQLPGGDVVVVAMSGEIGVNPILRILRFTSDLEYISQQSYQMGSAFRKVDGIYPTADDAFVVLFMNSSYRRFRLVKFKSDASVVWEQNRQLPSSVAAFQRVRLFALSDDNGRSYHTFLPSLILWRWNELGFHGFASFIYNNDGAFQQVFNRTFRTLTFSNTDFPSMAGCNREGNNLRFTFSYFSDTTPFVSYYQELLSLSGGGLVSTDQYETELLYVPGSTRTRVSEADEVITIGNKHLFVRRLNGEQYTEIVPLLNENISRLNYRQACLRPDGGWWVYGVAEDGLGSSKDVLIGLPKLDYNIEGKVFKDFNASCSEDGQDSVYQTTWVAFKNIFGYYAKPDEQGNYSIRLPDANYDVDVSQQGRLWEICTLQQQITVDADKIHDVPLTPKANCPDLFVDVSAPYLVRCAENTYTVTYSNPGPAGAVGAYIILKTDTLLSITAADIPFIQLSEGVYRFDIGNIAPDATEDFQIKMQLDCDNTITNQTHCVKANIYPDNLCTPSPACWDGSYLEIEGDCRGDSATFRIRNIGTGPLTNPRPMLVLEDDIMKIPATPMTLPAGGFSEITYFAGGKTIRLQVPQSDCFPFPSFPAEVLEGCGGIINTGFVRTLPQDDEVSFKSVWCLESLDNVPNAYLIADPKGYSDKRFITPSTQLEYVYSFKTDLPGSGDIYLIDTLSQHFDFSTFEVAGSTLPSNVNLFNNGVLLVTFNMDNNLESNASFKFRIKPLSATAPGTIIKNFGNFFRLTNESYATNEVFHTIQENFIEVKITGISEPLKDKLAVVTYPNPAGAMVKFSVAAQEFSSPLLIQVFDLQGKTMASQMLDRETIMDTAQWPSGTYIFTISAEGKQFASGKIVRQ